MKLFLVLLVQFLVIMQAFLPKVPHKSFKSFRLAMTTSYNLNAKDLLLADSCSGLSRAEINEFVLKLEKQNPTAEPAYSPLLNGVWEVVSAAIFSPGMVGLQAIKTLPLEIVSASDLTITIQSVSPRVTAATTIKVANANVPVSVITDLQAKSGVRLTESYEVGKVGSLEIPLTSLRTFSRDVLISYLDDDLLIARDLLGTPEILRRKEFVNARGESGDTNGEAPTV